MFIATETTPNPATLKFLPGQAVLAGRTAEFGPEQAGASPLADRVLAVDGVRSVYLGHDFVSVTRHEGQEWAALKTAVLGAVMEHFLSGDPVLAEGDGAAPEEVESTDPIVVQIKELLATRVRPAVARDGGDIVFQGFERGIVYLHMKGACSGCPSSTMTLKSGIENLLRHYIPEVIEVRSIG